MKKTILILFATLFFASCSTKNEASILQGDWILISFEKDGIAQIIAQANIAFKTENPKNLIYTGFNGVNNFSGNFKSSKKRISWGNVMNTRMSGPEELMLFEKDFMDSFMSCDLWEIKTNGSAQILELSSNEKNIHFQFLKNSLYFHNWILTDYIENNALVSVDSKASLEISQNGTVSVFTGINNFNSNAIIDEEKNIVLFENPLITLSLGSPEEVNIETAIITGLNSAKKFWLFGNNLSLLDSGDKTLLMFKKGDMRKLKPLNIEKVDLE